MIRTDVGPSGIDMLPSSYCMHAGNLKFCIAPYLGPATSQLVLPHQTCQNCPLHVARMTCEFSTQRACVQSHSCIQYDIPRFALGLVSVLGGGVGDIIEVTVSRSVYRREG